MTHRSEHDQRTSSDDRTSDDRRSEDRTSDAGERTTHAANRRVARLRGGLEKAVTGREAQIKAQAVKWAEQLDARWKGRHHNKLHVALLAVEFIVDRASKARDDGATGAAGGDGPEDLGEFQNLSDRERAAQR